MKVTLLKYKARDTFIDQLSGTTKLLCFLLTSFLLMLTFDTRVLVFVFLLNAVTFYASKIDFQQIKFVLLLVFVFLLMNNIMIFAFSPYEGTKIYGTKSVLWHLFGNYSITKEQLFYQFNVSLKYFCIIPLALIFINTTNPSDFAASLSRIGVSYKIGIAVSLTLRYIPDIQRDFTNIAVAQQSRGADLSKNEKFMKRIKSTSMILMPLIFSSFDRIGTISSAMELRRFGSQKKRTFYSDRPFGKRDYMVIGFFVCLFIVSMVITYQDGSRFYNPFI